MPGSELSELSGRSRAILKQYVDEDAATVSLPLGHRTVAFTEPQVYHLLRVLTDETLQMSYTTMEKLVLGAVKGTPVTTESRTDHFKIRNRAQTPRPRHLSDTCDGTRGNDDSGPGTDSTGELSTEGEDGVFDSYNGSDSSGEMALISQAFEGPKVTEADPVSQGGAEVNLQGEGHESTGQSSLDATLSELRHQETPRFFIAGPADPLHNPHMVWCHICKKNISEKTKGTIEFLRHHRT